MEDNIKNFYNNFDLISKTFFDEESKGIIEFCQSFLENYFFCSDVGCGYGFVSNKLNAREIIGFDISDYLLSVANLNKQNNTNYFQQDCAKPFDKKFKEYFDITFCLRSAFGVFNDFYRNELYFKNLVDITKENGKIILDIYNPYLIENHFKEKIIYEKHDYKLIRESKKDKNYVNQNWLFYKKEELISSNQLGVYIFKIEEIKNLIKKYNLNIINIHGDYHKNEYTNHSNRLIFILEKK